MYGLSIRLDGNVSNSGNLNNWIKFSAMRSRLRKNFVKQNSWKYWWRNFTKSYPILPLDGIYLSQKDKKIFFTGWQAFTERGIGTHDNKKKIERGNNCQRVMNDVLRKQLAIHFYEFAVPPCCKRILHHQLRLVKKNPKKTPVTKKGYR